jgi:Serine proteases of the peptidase family S9A
MDKTDAKFTYPPTKRVDVVDDYFGTKVPDPYRWLENENSAETKAWVDAENVLTFGYLDKIPYREKLKARLTELFNYPKVTAPFDAATLTSSPRMMDCKTKTCTTSKKV